MIRLRGFGALVLKSPVLAGAAVFVSALLVTLVFWIFLPPEFQKIESRDYFAFYEPEARSIAAGHWSELSGSQLPTRVPPGYPIFLAGLFGLASLLHLPETLVLSATTLLCMATTAVLLFLIARTIWGIPLALIVAGTWMTYPFALWLTKEPRSEMLFTLFLYCGFGLYWRALSRTNGSGRILFVSGIAQGLAMLIRPIGLAVGVVLSAIVWFTKRDLSAQLRLSMIAPLLLGNSVAILPWEAWVYQQTGKMIVLSTSGASSITDGLTFAQNPQGYREVINVTDGARAVMQEIAQSAAAGKMGTYTGILSIMAREFRTHPSGVVEIAWLKLWRSWYATDTGRYESIVGLIQAVYLAVVLWGAWRAWRLGGLPRQLALCLLALALYFWGVTFLALSILRYMVPVIGLTFLLIPGLFHLPRSAQRDER